MSDPPSRIPSTFRAYVVVITHFGGKVERFTFRDHLEAMKEAARWLDRGCIAEVR